MVDYRNLCQKAGKSVEGAWKHCGVGRTTFFSWMNGTSQPNEEQAELFADYVNEDASKLFPDICQIDWEYRQQITDEYLAKMDYRNPKFAELISESANASVKAYKRQQDGDKYSKHRRI